MHAWEDGDRSQLDRRCTTGLAGRSVSPAAGDAVLESAESKRRGSIDAPRSAGGTVRMGLHLLVCFDTFYIRSQAVEEAAYLSTLAAIFSTCS